MFWYLATPFSKYPAGIEAAHDLACRATALLTKQGVAVFSPIVHTFPQSAHGAPDTLDHGFWMKADLPFMRAAHGLLVLQVAGTNESVGVATEIGLFRRMGKPVRQILESHLEAPDVIDRLREFLELAG